MKKINTENKNYLLLSNNFVGKQAGFYPQVKKYLELLDILLKNNYNLAINLDFINDFNRYIYYDLNNEYSINSKKEGDKDIFNFVNQDRVSYKIKKTLTNTDNSSIFLLEKISQRENHVDLPEYQILKIYNGTIDESDYLSLEIGRITNNKKLVTITPNYYELTEDEFAGWNYNDIKLDYLIQTNRIDNSPDVFDKLYLSCKNINPINDFIINLILEKITSDNHFLNNFVKYNNLFITTINGQKRYCVLMDKMDGTIKDLYSHINDKIEPRHKNEFIRTLIYNILYDIQSILNPLKHKEFLFTHTDLKLENIFFVRNIISRERFEESIKENVKVYSTIEYDGYKSNFACVEKKIFEQKINTRDGLVVFYQLDFILADFDKSSITYKNIRFYNSESLIDSQSFFKQLFQATNFKKSAMEIELSEESVDTAEERFSTPPSSPGNLLSDSPVDLEKFTLLDITQGKYYIKRITPLEFGASAGTKNIETEQLIMRYNMFPFYTSFDIKSFILSLFCLRDIFDFTLEPSFEINKKLEKIFKKEFQNWSDLYRIYSVYNWSTITGNDTSELYIQNFGFLLQPLIISDKPHGLYNNKYPESEHIVPSRDTYSNKLYITNQYKICLSIPFNIIIQEVSAGIFKNIVYKIDKSKTITNMSKLKINLENLSRRDETSIEQLFLIYYTGDLVYMRPSGDNFIVKTNRYSKLSLPKSILYEYDDIGEDVVKFIIDKFFS